MGATASRGTLMTIAATLSLTLTACASEPEDAASPAQAETEPSPEVHRALRFQAQTTDGEQFDGETLADATAVLWFWTPDCGECSGLASVVAATDQAYENIDFHGVAGRAELEEIQAFEAQNGLEDMTTLVDEYGTIWGGFEVISPPSFVFLRSDGTHTTVSGAMTVSELDETIAQELE
ncbi:thioredoxin family protein [Nocardiopsis alba]|uniref:thioredoxin family protein n=1 Tax=Nocardiopsis alba TaxID=53437 RepID=UPI0033ADECFF